jgi:hypothetical protein
MAQRYRDVLPKILAGETVGAADADADSTLGQQQATAAVGAADAPPPMSKPPLPPPPPLAVDWAPMEAVTVVGRASGLLTQGVPGIHWHLLEDPLQYWTLSR